MLHKIFESLVGLLINLPDDIIGCQLPPGCPRAKAIDMNFAFFQMAREFDSLFLACPFFG
jgi:hypothetical protein